MPTTLTDLATKAATTTGLNHHTVATALAFYLNQVDELDGTTTDPDNIDDTTAEFLLAAVEHAHRAGDFGTDN
ncbi:hypothetical protein [Corynebacterium sp. HMSC22B11]|uniref:hypothetical protein n=1 Tax=Corynebacterium sp. HMSC22B11 TaxID=1581056 RepID=UPI000A7374DC|nr:hypothetical protein [Corynebacterium sp. HMSC22B11]